MGWKSVFRGIGRAVKAVAPVAAPIAGAFGGPMAATLINAIVRAEQAIGPGRGEEKAAWAITALQVAAPYIVRELEEQFGRDLPEDAIEKYIRAQINAHVDLCNAVGLLKNVQDQG